MSTIHGEQQTETVRLKLSEIIYECAFKCWTITIGRFDSVQFQ